jgi:lipid-A-disaccharide synthase
MPNKLGLLAGGGRLPARLIERCRAAGREIFVLCFEGQTDPGLAADLPHAWVRLGAAEEAIRRLREAGVRELVMAGAMRRPSAQELRPDWRAAQFLARIGIGALGDDGLLRAVRAELEREGFTLVGVDSVLRELVAPAGTFGSHGPDAQAEADIARGLEVIAALGAVDVGQAAVVQQGVVLGIEAAEGTDALIERCGRLQRRGPAGVLVKAAKPGQAREMDLPAIGPETVERAIAAGLRGIAVEAGNTLVLDRERLVRRADEAGIFVVGRVAQGEPPLFYLIAGEPSGDVLGARLMRALRAATDGRARFAGIGGEQMAEEGLKSLVPIRELAIMGLLEVVPAARRILRRVRETVAEIERLRPVAIVTIDSSGFCFRVAERLRKRGTPPPIIHYVAPMVWAWRPHRAKHAARAADHLLTLFPFEPPYFDAVGLPATFVGHPVAEAASEPVEEPAEFRSRHGIDPAAPILTVLPGSRRGEVRTLLPVFGETVARLAERYPGLVVLVPTVETVAEEVGKAVMAWPGRSLVLRGAAEKRAAFSASSAALAASGTVVLELAAAGVPMVVAYRIWPLTHWLLMRSAKVRFASMVNIMLGREAVPERLQEDCTPQKLAAEIAHLLDDPAAREAQRAAFATVMAQLSPSGSKPSERAAAAILDVVARRGEEDRAAR